MGETPLRLLVAAVREYAIFMLDATGHVMSWNAGAELIKGYCAAEILGRHFAAFYPASDVEAGHPAQHLAAAVAAGHVQYEGWRVRQDGTRFWADVVITALHDDSGQLLGFGKVTRDLTARRAAEQALRESEERFRLLVAGVREYAIFMLDPTGHVVSWNAGAELIKRYRAPEILGRHFSVFYPPQDVDAGHPARHLADAVAAGHVQYQGWRLRGDGSRFWADVVITALYDDTGGLQGFGKVTRDLTERRDAEQALLHRCLHDPLTGLPNRVLLVDRLQQALARLERRGGSIAVFFLDLEQFKAVNDRYGHEVGDRLLRKVGERLTATLRPEDVAARLGGDEFVVVCADLTGDLTVEHLAARLSEAFLAPFRVDEHDLAIGTSIGVAVATSADEDPAALIRDADTAMYRFKRGRRPGGVGYTLFEPGMREPPLRADDVP